MHRRQWHLAVVAVLRRRGVPRDRHSPPWQGRDCTFTIAGRRCAAHLTRRLWVYAVARWRVLAWFLTLLWLRCSCERFATYATYRTYSLPTAQAIPT